MPHSLSLHLITVILLKSQMGGCKITNKYIKENALNHIISSCLKPHFHMRVIRWPSGFKDFAVCRMRLSQVRMVPYKTRTTGGAIGGVQWVR